MPAVVIYVTGNNSWSVMQKDGEGTLWEGEWAGFTDKRVAENFARWLNENFDTDGMIERLYGSGNTPEDKAIIRLINQRREHVTAVPTPYPETIATRLERERGKPNQ